MDSQLREVLSEERDVTHHLAEDERSAHEIERVVDTEGVEHSREQHVLSDEGHETGAF